MQNDTFKMTAELEVKILFGVFEQKHFLGDVWFHILQLQLQYEIISLSERWTLAALNEFFRKTVIYVEDPVESTKELLNLIHIKHLVTIMEGLFSPKNDTAKAIAFKQSKGEAIRRDFLNLLKEIERIRL